VEVVEAEALLICTAVLACTAVLGSFAYIARSLAACVVVHVLLTDS
jgi:ABC-type antimicrobial peptide transport system permease subunit